MDVSMSLPAWTNAKRMHYYLFTKLADARSQDWPFMANPYLLTVITIIYLYWILDLGPRYMHKRKPYNMKHIIQVYNAAQVAASFYIFYQILTTAFMGRLSLGCEIIDYSNDPFALKLLTFCWYSTMQKLTEYIETVFFILRKKNSQASFLHIYHHVSTLSLCWLATKYFGGGMIVFPIMLNAFIHVVMYSYYFLASLGPDMQKRIDKWKKYLTIMQMVQFVIILAHTIRGMSPDCAIPKTLAYIYIPDVSLVFYMFYDFYRKTYTKDSKVTPKVHAKDQ